MKRSERLATSVTPEEKTKFELIAQRRDMEQAKLLYELVQEFLDGEEIPDEVLQWVEEGRNEGNPKPAATAD